MIKRGPPIKVACSRGHVISEVGRYRDGSCSECKRQRARKDRWQQPVQERTWSVHGIINEDGSPFSQVDYDRAYQIQQGKCLGCKRHSTEFTRRLAADHDHSTGKFRGLLCGPCNLLLGRLEKHKETILRLTQLLK